MKPNSESVEEMLAQRYQRAPQARLKVDIDPPFVGRDFMADACDPSLHEFDGVLYLTFIDNSDGTIKVGVVDTKEMRISSIFRTITAAAARNPRLCFEPSTYPGKSDLPHVAYDDTATGKVMVYREEYDSQGNVLVIRDEIGNGTHADTGRFGEKVVDFYLSGGVLYSRIQGQYAEVLIDNTGSGEIITSSRCLALPDLRIGVIYAVLKNDGTYEARMAYSRFVGAFETEDNLAASLQMNRLDFKQTVFYLDDSLGASLSTTSLMLNSTLYSFDGDVLGASLQAKSLDLRIGSYTVEESQSLSVAQVKTRFIQYRAGNFVTDEAQKMQATLTFTTVQLF